MALAWIISLGLAFWVGAAYGDRRGHTRAHHAKFETIKEILEEMLKGKTP